MIAVVGSGAAGRVEGYVAKGVNPDLALRVYTTRLLGVDPELVLHGGGNTSVKTTFTERDGTQIPVICIKGSGWDMAVIEPEGLPACRRPELAALARFERLSDPDMVSEQRRLLIDPASLNPSVEAILHDPRRASRSHLRQRHCRADQPTRGRAADATLCLTPSRAPARGLEQISYAGQAAFLAFLWFAGF